MEERPATRVVEVRPNPFGTSETQRQSPLYAMIALTVIAGTLLALPSLAIVGVFYLL